MRTSTAHPSATRRPARRPPHLRAFHTPVRGHAFAQRPPAGAPLEHTSLVLRREPDNPADLHALAVWAEDGGAPWRVGYLDRAVAARLAPHVTDDCCELRVVFAGWWEEPEGRWFRPVVRVGDDSPQRRPDARPSVRRLPPARVVRAA